LHEDLEGEVYMEPPPDLLLKEV